MCPNAFLILTGGVSGFLLSFVDGFGNRHIADSFDRCVRGNVNGNHCDTETDAAHPGNAFGVIRFPFEPADLLEMPDPFDILKTGCRVAALLSMTAVGGTLAYGIENRSMLIKEPITAIPVCQRFFRIPQAKSGGPRCQGPSCVPQNARELYPKDIADRWFLVFYFLLYVYYYNSRKKNNRRGKAGGQKGGTFMKIVKKIEALLNAYYETFKH